MKTIGRYRVERILGSGAFATVWLGEDPVLEAPVAIKVLADNWSANADIRERFVTEARLLRRIDDPRVVRVYDIGSIETDGVERPYFVMEYIGGGTLAERVGHLAPDEALRFGIAAAEAVEVLHRAGVVHRDVKPANLLVDESTAPSRVVLSDLGSAKNLADASGVTVATGTPAYMAPEQIHATGGFDGRADVYAVAAVTYELLSGRVAFGDRTLAAVLDRRPDARPEPLAPRLDVPPELDRLLARALSRSPARRPQTAAAFAAELRRIARDDAPRARQAPTLLVVLGCVLVALGLGTATYWVLTLWIL